MRFLNLFKYLTIFLFIFNLIHPLIFCKPFLAERFNQIAQEKDSKPDEIIQIIKSKLKVNQSIVDLGAGGGYFSLRFAKEVVPEGTVYAVDIENDYLKYIEKIAQKEKIKNIEYILAKEDDSNLPDNLANLIFIRNVFHHIENPEDYFLKLRRKLKQGGYIVIIDYIPEFAPGGLKKHSTEPQRILTIMKNSGYELVENYDILPKQSFFIFKIKEN
jgi:ubiquinone/menaquinone biosynthesis C-methylase UbiE